MPKNSRPVVHRSAAPTATERQQGGSDFRRTIAGAAARLVAEGLTDYHAAKVKAAKSLSVHAHTELPSDAEVEAALREHMQLFESETQPRALAALREVAIEAMEWLQDFSPWISGAVLNGTANEFSAIELEIINPDTKQLEIFLLNSRIDWTSSGEEGGSREARAQARRRALRYELTYRDAPLEITIFESHAARLAHFPKNHTRHDRAQLAEAKRRFT
jgi:hypothetical protein